MDCTLGPSLLSMISLFLSQCVVCVSVVKPDSLIYIFLYNIPVVMLHESLQFTYVA